MLGLSVAGDGGEGLVHAVQAQSLTEPHPQPPWFVFVAFPFPLRFSTQKESRDYKQTQFLPVRLCQKGKDEGQHLKTLPGTTLLTKHGRKRSSEHLIEGYL